MAGHLTAWGHHDDVAAVNINARLDAAIKAAGVPIVGVSMGDITNKATWRVHPAALQAAAQATIDAFNPALDVPITTPRTQAIEAITAANTVAGLKAALLTYLTDGGR